MRLIFVIAAICVLSKIAPAFALSNAVHMGVQNVEHFRFIHASGHLCDHRGSHIRVANVDMDRYLVVRGSNPAVATTGLSTCIAVCGIGKVDHEKVLCLGHVSAIVSPKCALRKVTYELYKQGCSWESIKIFLIGGYPEGEGLCDEQLEFCQLAERFNIRRVLFNPLNLVYQSDSDNYENRPYHDRSINVIFTPKALFFGEHLAIDEKPGFECCGYYDWEDNYEVDCD